MPNLKAASRELYRRTPDETFRSLPELFAHCQRQKEEGRDRWVSPRGLRAVPEGGRLALSLDGGEPLEMNDWSFTQLCGLARAAKDTVNRLTPDTAARVLGETLPDTAKPVQLFQAGGRLRSVHGVSYSRLHDADLVSVLMEFAVDFGPPPAGANGATGLYAGEQDLFCFLIDPTGWAEVNGEAFAPGFFVWNSEVGKRSVGVSTFWFQAVCRNHIVWDATDVLELTRKHTGSVGDALTDIRRAVGRLVETRDARRDGFVQVVKTAMQTTLGDDAEAVLKVLAEKGIPKSLGKLAVEAAKTQGRFTVFSVVDALTRLAGEAVYAGDRHEADRRAAGLLDLVAA